METEGQKKGSGFADWLRASLKGENQTGGWWKILLCMVVFFCFCVGVWREDLGYYVRYPVMEYGNTAEFAPLSASSGEMVSRAQLSFPASGELLSRVEIALHVEELPAEGQLKVWIEEENGQELKRTEIDFLEFGAEDFPEAGGEDLSETGMEDSQETGAGEADILEAGGADSPEAGAGEILEADGADSPKAGEAVFHGLSLEVSGLKEGASYQLLLQGTGGEVLSGTVSVQLGFTSSHVGVPFLMEMGIWGMEALFFAFLLMAAVWKWEDWLGAFREGMDPKGVAWGIYLAVSALLLYNPMKEARTKVLDFGRTFGAGVKGNYDCSRVIHNFHLWFLVFGLVLCSYVFLMNGVRKRQYSREQNHAWSYLDVCLAVDGVVLALRGITYFRDGAGDGRIFTYSSWLIGIIMAAGGAYIFLNLDRKIRWSRFLQAVVSMLGLGYSVTLCISRGWESGRLLIGVQAFLVGLVVGIVAAGVWGPGCFRKTEISGKFLNGVSVVFAAIPLVTSLYIEGINVMNQYRIFVGDPGKGYWILTGIMLVLAVAAGAILARKQSAFGGKGFIFGENGAVSGEKGSGFGNAPVSGEKGSGFGNAPVSGENQSGFGGNAPVFGEKVPAFEGNASVFDEKQPDFNWKKWVYPLFLIGTACLSIQIGLQTVRNVSLIEAANSSILISDFLCYGKLPIVEHYGAHMLTQVVEGIFYGWLNQDFAGAVFSPYYNVPAVFQAVLFYGVLALMLEKDLAFWITLVFPYDSQWRYFGMGAVVCLAMATYVRKNSYGRAFLLWMTCVYCALLRLDLGYSFGLAAVAAGLLYGIFTKNKKVFSQLFLTLAGVVAFFGALWVILCGAKGIHPMERLLEFLLISMSNQNWAYHGIGNPDKIFFSWTYLFLPLAVEGCVLYGIFSRKFREKAGMGRFLVLMIFGIAYLVNFSRGLVRHSMIEMDRSVPFWSAYVFLALFAACLIQRKKVFLPVFALLMVCSSVVMQNQNFKERSLAEQECVTLGPLVDTWIRGPLGFTMWDQIREEQQAVERIPWADELTEHIEPLRQVMDHVLLPEETFLDFMNQTFLYSALGRENPVYVSQSPMQLSGEYTQEKYVEQMQRNQERIPLVLMPEREDFFEINLDGIPNVFRYYKVSEFIYQNYRPLCRTNGVAFWCLPERYEEMAAAVESLPEVERIGWGYDGKRKNGGDKEKGDLEKQEGREAEGQKAGESREDLEEVRGLHDYSVGYLPGLWAEYDKKNALENPVLVSAERRGKNFFAFEGNAFSKEKGNYLLLIVDYPGKDTEGRMGQADEACGGTLKLGVMKEEGFEEKYQFHLMVNEGVHAYLLRVSCDYYWYAEQINGAVWESEEEVYVKEVKVLEGD